MKKKIEYRYKVAAHKYMNMGFTQIRGDKTNIIFVLEIYYDAFPCL